MKFSTPVKAAFGLFVIILVAVAVIRTVSKKKRAKQAYERFYSSDVQGKISHVTASQGTTYFTISTGEKFQFNPYINEAYNKIFNEVAHANDSVFKSRYSDTLYVFRDAKVYGFTFYKFQ